jgi:hypothetical protein
MSESGCMKRSVDESIEQKEGGKDEEKMKKGMKTRE